MSKTLIYGDEIVFTSRSGNGVINLSAGAGETLQVQGYSTSGDVPSSPLTSQNGVNVTLTVNNGENAVLQPTHLIAGWTGELHPAQGGTGVSNANTITVGGTFSTNSRIDIQPLSTIGTLLYTGATNTISPLPKISNGTLGTDINGTPYLSATLPYQVQNNITSLGNISTVLNVDNTTNATSSSTGSIITDGGVGIAKNLYVAGAIVSTLAQGTAPLQVSSNTKVVGLTSSFLDVVDNSIDNTNYYPMWSATTSPGITSGYITSSKYKFNPSTGKLTATSFDGNWDGAIIDGDAGGTGVQNTGKTITLGGNLETIGANSTILRTTGATDVTLPTSGTLLSTDSTIPSISGYSDKASIGYKVIATGTDYQHTDTANARSQGISVGIAKDISDGSTWAIAGSPYPKYPDIALGGLAVWKSTGGAFVQNTLLLRQSFTDYADTAKYSHIDDTATAIFFQDLGAPSSYSTMYRRVSGSDTWTYKQIIADCVKVRSNGLYAIVSNSYSAVRIMLNNGTDTWSNQQTITIQTSANATDVCEVDIYGDTCVIANSYYDNIVYIFSRSGISWTKTGSLYKNLGDSTILTVSMSGNVIAFCTSNALYVAKRANSSSSYLMKSVIYKSNILWCSVSPNEQIVLVNNTGVSIYYDSGNTGTIKETYNLAGTDVTNAYACDNYIIQGQPALSTYGRILIHGITNASSEIIEDNKTFFDGQTKTTSDYAVEITTPLYGEKGSLVVAGDLKVSGRIHGFTNASYTLAKVGATQSFSHNALAGLQGTPWYNSMGYFSKDITFDRVNGRMIIQTSGLYTATASIVWMEYGTGHREIQLLKTGVILTWQNYPMTVSRPTAMNITYTIPMAIGDYFHIQAMQSSGGSLNVTDGSLLVYKVGEI